MSGLSFSGVGYCLGGIWVRALVEEMIGVEYSVIAPVDGFAWAIDDGAVGRPLLVAC